jgi:hypothetical protein
MAGRVDAGRVRECSDSPAVAVRGRRVRLRRGSVAKICEGSAGANSGDRGGVLALGSPSIGVEAPRVAVEPADEEGLDRLANGSSSSKSGSGGVVDGDVADANEAGNACAPAGALIGCGEVEEEAETRRAERKDPDLGDTGVVGTRREEEEARFPSDLAEGGTTRKEGEKMDWSEGRFFGAVGGAEDRDMASEWMKADASI